MYHVKTRGNSTGHTPENHHTCGRVALHCLFQHFGSEMKREDDPRNPCMVGYRPTFRHCQIRRNTFFGHDVATCQATMLSVCPSFVPSFLPQ
jgi:hypothetical protein